MVKINVTATDDINNARVSSLNIFPVPVKETLTVGNSALCLQGQKVFVSIQNIDGRVIYSKSLLYDGNPFSINVQYLTEGIYILRLQTDHKSFTERFVKL